MNYARGSSRVDPRCVWFWGQGQKLTVDVTNRTFQRMLQTCLVRFQGCLSADVYRITSAKAGVLAICVSATSRSGDSVPQLLADVWSSVRKGVAAARGITAQAQLQTRSKEYMDRTAIRQFLQDTRLPLCLLVCLSDLIYLFVSVATVRSCMPASTWDFCWHQGP